MKFKYFLRIQWHIYPESPIGRMSRILKVKSITANDDFSSAYQPRSQICWTHMTVIISVNNDRKFKLHWFSAFKYENRQAQTLLHKPILKYIKLSHLKMDRAFSTPCHKWDSWLRSGECHQRWQWRLCFYREADQQTDCRLWLLAAVSAALCATDPASSAWTRAHLAADNHCTIHHIRTEYRILTSWTDVS